MPQERVPLQYVKMLPPMPHPVEIRECSKEKGMSISLYTSDRSHKILPPLLKRCELLFHFYSSNMSKKEFYKDPFVPMTLGKNNVINLYSFFSFSEKLSKWNEMLEFCCGLLYSSIIYVPEQRRRYVEVVDLESEEEWKMKAIQIMKLCLQDDVPQITMKPPQCQTLVTSVQHQATQSAPPSRAESTTGNTARKTNLLRELQCLHSPDEYFCPQIHTKKRELKSVKKFEPENPSNGLLQRRPYHHELSLKGFSCPVCEKICPYDSTSCGSCGVKCQYVTGMGVVTLQERPTPEKKKSKQRWGLDSESSSTTLPKKSPEEESEVEEIPVSFHRQSERHKRKRRYEEVLPDEITVRHSYPSYAKRPAKRKHSMEPTCNHRLIAKKTTHRRSQPKRTTIHFEEVQRDCICGIKHNRWGSFWLQCDDCDVWYLVAKKCVGFSHAQAMTEVDSWSCTDCSSCSQATHSHQTSQMQHAQANQDPLTRECICAKKHRTSTFWLQCDGCELWYRVSQKCVGFSCSQAEEWGSWFCLECCERDDVCQKRKVNCIKIQSFVRGWRERGWFRRMCMGVVCLQKVWRMYRQRCRYRLTLQRIIQIQCLFRRWVAMRQKTMLGSIQCESMYKLQYKSICCIQAVWRRYRQTTRYRGVLQKICRMQTCWRRYRALKVYHRSRRCICRIQTVFRTYACKKLFHRQRRSVCILQKYARRFLIQQWFLRKISILRIHRSVCILQTFTRRWICRKRYHRMRRSVCILQKYTKSFLRRKWFLLLKKSICLIQRAFRRWIWIGVERWLQRSICIAQTAFRKWICRKRYYEMRRSVCILQKYTRRFLVQKWYLSTLHIIVRIQSQCRRFLNQKWFHRIRIGLDRMRMGVILLQSYVRMHLALKQVEANKQSEKRSFNCREFCGANIESIEVATTVRKSTRLRRKTSDGLPLHELKIRMSANVSDSEEEGEETVEEKESWYEPKEISRRSWHWCGGLPSNISEVPTFVKNKSMRLCRALKIQRNEKILLFVKSPKDATSTSASGLFVLYKGPRKRINLTKDIDLGIYGGSYDIKTEKIMQVKDFLFDQIPMTFGRKTDDPSEHFFLDVTCDKTGAVHENANKNLLPYARDVTSEMIAQSRKPGSPRLNSYLRAAYHEDGTLHYILRKDINLHKDEEIELFHCIDVPDFKPNLADTNCSSSSSNESASTSFPTAQMGFCSGAQADRNECNDAYRGKPIPGYFKTHKRIHKFTESDVRSVLSYFLANPPRGNHARYRMIWFTKQLHLLCTQNLFYTVPNDIENKVKQVLSLFPRKSGEFMEEDAELMQHSQYLGARIRLFRVDDTKGYNTTVDGIVENVYTMRGNEVRYIVKFDSGDVEVMTASEIEELQFNFGF